MQNISSGKELMEYLKEVNWETKGYGLFFRFPLLFRWYALTIGRSEAKKYASMALILCV
jgi:hypothetical protein